MGINNADYAAGVSLRCPSITQLSRLSLFFGLLATFLVAIGLYGNLAFRLTHRTSEIGVRMAVGAQRWQVLVMLLRESLQVTIAGLTLGLLLALISAGLMKSLLFGLQPRDPRTFAIASGLVVLVSLVASLLPARRAASIAPMQVSANGIAWTRRCSAGILRASAEKFQNVKLIQISRRNFELHTQETSTSA